jgi:hypothetical protein
MSRSQLIQVRRDSATNWSAAQTAAGATPVLDAGEFGLDVNNKILKIGDGSSLWGPLNAVKAGTLSTSLSPILGGTGRTDGSCGPLLFYTINSGSNLAYDWTGAAGTTGSFTTTDNVSIFGKGVTLADNTAYDIEMLICYQFLCDSSASLPTLSFVPSNGLTFQTSGINVAMFSYASTTADTGAATTAKYELWNTGSSLSGVSLLPTGTLSSTGTVYYFKNLIKGNIRTGTNSGTANTGIFTPKISISAGTTSLAKMRDGSFIKLAPIATGTGTATSLGTWV